MSFIVMWSGTIAGIPSGFQFLDGTGGIKDLRNKFIVGAKQDDSGVPKTNVTGALTQSGGAANVTIDTSTMPAHNHSSPAHNHGYDCRGSSTGGDNTPFSGMTNTVDPSSTRYGDLESNAAIFANAGGGESHPNVPPFVALPFCLRL